MLIDISPDDLETVQEILINHVPELEVRAFGSRVNWTARQYSDLDLVLMTHEPLDISHFADLCEAFSQSDLPFRVDILDWASTSESFREIIEKKHAIVKNKSEKKLDTDNKWPTMSLGDCVVINDSTYSPKEAWPFINYLDTGNITENRISKIQNLTTGKDKIPSRARRKVCLGDIVYSTVRPNQKHFGLLKNIPENFLVSTGFSVIRAKSSYAHTSFIYWFLAQDHIVEYLQTIAEHSTSAYPSIRPTDIECLKFNLPPLPEQRVISHILDTLDDKIELNRRMSETLEEMAQALFKSWFVDFDPVRAKMEGRWRRGESLPGLPADLWELFPSKMVKSKMGKIPEGWKAAPLSELIEINPKRFLEPKQLAPYLNMASMPRTGHVPSALTNRPFGSGTKFTNGDTLLARITPCLENGKTAYVDFLLNDEIGWGSTEFIVMRPKPPLPNEFAYCLSRSPSFRKFAIQNMTGTSGRQRVPTKAISEFILPSSPECVATSFGKNIKPLLAQASKAILISSTLSALRDTLLPKIVSGEMKVEQLVL